MITNSICRPWEPDEVTYLLTHQHKKQRDIARHLGRTPRAIRSKVAELRKAGLLPATTNGGGKRPTICWNCQRAAGPRMCTWALFGKPVKDWKALPTIVNDNEPSYCVQCCPQYMPDERRKISA